LSIYSQLTCLSLLRYSVLEWCKYTDTSHTMQPYPKTFFIKFTNFFLTSYSTIIYSKFKVIHFICSHKFEHPFLPFLDLNLQSKPKKTASLAPNFSCFNLYLKFCVHLKTEKLPQIDRNFFRLNPKLI
ncbi:hypothetical protein SAMN05421638_1994, partial [Kaistella treverensis]